ncbi:MAG: hypothetical protein K8R63_05080, partial [Bacteroidales bacterium]|nr:hypothetical protein [Bacteroidales bacterium]
MKIDTGYWLLDAGCWMLDTGYWILDTGYWLLVQPNTQHPKLNTSKKSHFKFRFIRKHILRPGGLEGKVDVGIGNILNFFNFMFNLQWQAFCNRAVRAGEG